MKKFLASLLVALAMGIVLAGCPHPVGTDSGGSLTVNFTALTAKTLLPEISMDAASYRVEGSGPRGTGFSEEVFGAESLTVSGLAFGPWVVTVTARNEELTPIGAGTEDAVVRSNASAAVFVTVRPYAGFGTLSLALSWNAGDVDVARVEASLLPAVGAVRDLPFSVDGAAGTAVFSASDVASGYHTLTLKLTDNGAVVMGAVEIARIAADATTSGSFYFDRINRATGTLEVNITPEMAEPLEVEISGGEDTKPAGDVLYLTAEAVNYADNVSWVWYVNAEAVGTGPAFAFGTSWAPGYYRIDAAAFSADGTRAGSANLFVQVQESGPEAGVAAIMAGGFNTFFLKDDGTLWGTGYNRYGQIGDGTTDQKNTPVTVMSGVSSAVPDIYHTMIITADGTLWTAGWNNYGQLGNGSTVDSSVPVPVMGGVAAVSGGSMHTMIIRHDGQLWAVGRNDYGAFGDGTTTSTSVPVPVMYDVASVSAGVQHTMILKTDRTLWATGWNNHGQLGDGTTLDRSIPVMIMTDVSAVCTGGYHTMILKTDGSLWGTGHNSMGTLGDGTNVDKTYPVYITGDVSAVSTLGYLTMILKNDGTLWATGNNAYGQLGDGTTDYKNVPIHVASDVATVTAGLDHTMIRKTDGSIWVTGSNDEGQFGDGTTTGSLIFKQIM